MCSELLRISRHLAPLQREKVFTNWFTRVVVKKFTIQLEYKYCFGVELNILVTDFDYYT